MTNANDPVGTFDEYGQPAGLITPEDFIDLHRRLTGLVLTVKNPLARISAVRWFNESLPHSIREAVTAAAIAELAEWIDMLAEAGIEAGCVKKHPGKSYAPGGEE